jgi:hypothetical protein
MSQGKLPETEAISREILAARLRTLSPDHPHTLEAMSDWAETLESVGKLAEAERILVDATARSRRVLGESHLFTLSIINSLAEV